MSAFPAARVAFIAVRVAALIVILLALSRIALVAWAEHEYTRGGLAAVQRAERILPSNPRYHYTRALILQENDPVSPEIESEFALATAQNPRYSDALLAWSVEKELKGDNRDAGRLLLDAQRVDHLLRPAWASTNFYFRQNDAANFWPQARECLRIIGKTGLSEGWFDPVPVYQLCWRMEPNSAKILSEVMPETHTVLDSYLAFLLTSHRIDAAIEVASKILPAAQPPELLVLRPYCDALLANGRIDAAMRAWSLLFGRHMVPYRGPEPASGIFLTNASLDGPPLGFGFDWHAIFPEPLRFTYTPGDHVYRFDFSSEIPEQFPLLYQTLPLTGGKVYRFTARFRADFNPEPAGLRWSFTDHASQQPLPALTGLAGDQERTLTLTFEAPASTTAGDLHLSYARQPGTPRVQGYYELLQTTLSAK